ncbi:hypothetical protein ScPMuIL_000045 [Solemya velum]
MARSAGDFNLAVYLLVVIVEVTVVESFCKPSEACWPTSGTIAAFENSLTGSIVERGDAKYEDLVIMKNARTTKYPTLMVLVKTTEDVQKSIRFARTHDIRITIQSSGHDFIGRSTDDFSLQINMAEMKDVAVDLSSARHSDGEITVGSGCSWKEIYQEVDTNGRVILGGSTHTVSPGGYTLGGGHSPVSRTLGLAVDNVLEFEMVDVDGNLVKSTSGGTDITFENGTTTSNSDAELFWALRGGGGGTFGVVTKFIFKLHQPPSQVVKFYCGYALLAYGQVIGKNMIKTFISLIKDLPTEWGGYFILIGSPISSIYFGPIMFVLNHYGTMTNEHKLYLEPLYNLCADDHNFTEFDSFWKYEETIVEEEYTWLYTFNTLMSADDFTDDWVNFVTDQMTNPPAGSTFGCTGTLIGGKVKEIGKQETSVHPAFRSTDMSLTCYVAWSYETRHLDNRYVDAAKSLGRKLQTYGRGVYVNEPAADPTNWKSDFWGDNYDKLYEIKKKWDPAGQLQCRYCVGYVESGNSADQTTFSAFWMFCEMSVILGLTVLP